MTGHVTGWALLSLPVLLIAWMLWTIRHPGTCGCRKCARRQQRREAAQWAYQERRLKQRIRRGARAAARAERRRQAANGCTRRDCQVCKYGQPDDGGKPLSDGEKGQWIILRAVHGTRSAPEPVYPRRGQR